MSSRPLRSMTGFAMVKRETPAGELTVTLRSVNHRGLDLHFHHAPELAPFENAMRTVLKQNIARGHVEIRAFIKKSDTENPISYNRELINRFIESHRKAALEHQLVSEPDLNVAFALPGVFNADSSPAFLDASFENEIVTAMDDCVRDLNTFRSREGAELSGHLSVEVAGIEENAAVIAQIRSRALPEYRDRLTQRLTELLGSTNVPQSRILEEAAILVDRSDVQEELTRLSVHATELRRLLESGGEVGKRLDFLLQELNRETNTILSKTSGAGEAGLDVTRLALNIKAHVEKIREQALNLE